MAKGEWSGGKGSSPRPISDHKQFEDNWDRIFGKKKDQQQDVTATEQTEQEHGDNDE